jgi:hypothetical protein
LERQVASSLLDGNAIAGLLVDVFGVEMTTATGTCGSCSASAPVGELGVYVRSPGVVVRCGTCDAVLMVVVDIRGVQCVDLRGLAALGL